MSATLFQISTAPWRVRRRLRVSRDTRASHLKVLRPLVHSTIALRSRRSGWLHARRSPVRFGRPYDMRADGLREQCRWSRAPRARMRAARDSGGLTRGVRRKLDRRTSQDIAHALAQHEATAVSSCTFEQAARSAHQLPARVHHVRSMHWDPMHHARLLAHPRAHLRLPTCSVQ